MDEFKKELEKLQHDELWALGMDLSIILNGKAQDFTNKVFSLEFDLLNCVYREIDKRLAEDSLQ